jgi:DICT domain-containing protein
MTLRRVIEFIKSHEKDLVLFNISATDPLGADLRERFDTQNVRVRTAQTASGTPEIAVLSNDDSVLTVERIATLRDAVAADPDQSRETTVGANSQDLPFFTYLKETTFTSYDRTQLLYASREIEDRARRIGTGRLHSCFQRVSIMADEQDVYADLAQRGVDVHAYGIPDADPPDVGAGHVHAVDTDEIAQSWFVVFNGGSDETQKSALIAHEESPNSFFGAWTYDPQLVDRVCTYLDETYLTSNVSNPSD